ncbi:lactonase family protein [Flavisolibacter nicotianae]|uniref:lactonase family protein n=1 Tax=Flavisolibacter nicotianae TaxID=2364882 RepID=UPI000EB08498|nr:beta-propeller fold lactonase family protein [Flavisolibacter nicotianae]
MKKSRYFLALAVAGSSLVFSCKKETMSTPANEALAAKAGKSEGAKEKTSVGYVYTLSNEVAANRVLAFSRSVTGTLTYEAAYATGGSGTGSGLGSQGAITLSADRHILLAVNAASNSVSSFTVSDGGDLRWQSTVPSGGVLPVSVAVYRNLVYVVNAGGSGNISGFTLDAGGSLEPLSGSARPLSSSGAGPAEIAFAREGKGVVITEKAANTILSYTIDGDGTPGTIHTLPSANATPFGFAVGTNGLLYVSEAGGSPGSSSVSAYRVDEEGVITLLDGPVSAGQTAACWVVLTNNGKYAYATNAGSSTVSSFLAGHGGSLQVARAVAANTKISGPIDAALSNNSKYLYVLNSRSQSISAFSVDHDSGLGFLQNLGGLPVSAVGLAAK